MNLIDIITKKIGAQFRTFGKPLQFAAGVNVESVVKAVFEELANATMPQIVDTLNKL